MTPAAATGAAAQQELADKQKNQSNSLHAFPQCSVPCAESVQASRRLFLHMSNVGLE